MRGDLVVIGAGGHAKVVIATARAAGWRVVAAFDDDAAKVGTRVLDVPVEGPIASAAGLAGSAAVLALGDNRIRAATAARLTLEWTSLVHPSAIVHESVRIGHGAVIFAGAVVQPETVIGQHVIVNTAASLDHDCRIGAFAHIAPGVHLAGEVVVGAGALIGIGACVSPGVSIGDHAVVGAGSVVVRDLPAGVTAVGIPARPLETL